MRSLWPMTIALAALVVISWVAYVTYSIEGLERRVNLVEASQHWQEEPPAKEAK